LNRYERQIVSDLAEQGWDVPALFRARRWRFLLALIDGLVPTSRTVVAMLNDPDRFEETARQIVDSEDRCDDTEARMREQTPVVRLLQDIFDLVSAAIGGKEPYPRPVSAVELALEDVRAERLRNFRDETLAALLPGWTND
jgi:hypothetical protein